MADARDTKKQENGSLVFFQELIEKGKEPTIAFVEQKAYPDMPAIWYFYYQLQGKALKQYLGNEKDYAYSRDDGIMPILEDAAKMMGVTTKDNWNPMDIVMVKKREENKIIEQVKKIKDASDEKQAKLEKLNLLMQELLVKKILIPISLKGLTKTSKEAKIEEANLGKKKQIEFKLKPNSLNCDLDMEKPPLFDTGEFSLRFFAGESEYALQVRSFRYSKPTTGPQTDITPKSGGAKLGKASVEATRPFLKKLNLDLPPSVVKDPMINTSGKFTSQQIDFWTNFYDKIKDVKIEGQKVNWDAPLVYGDRKSSFKNNLITGLNNFERDRNTLGRIFSKLHALRTIALYQTISQKGEFDKWLETLYYGAKKEFSNLNGPFIKIF
jgi:hypothetical protein|tara:strand:+ start:655 stop:1800 length:1146 start_codon:yes stop_codon:yes gene_type:complete